MMHPQSFSTGARRWCNAVVIFALGAVVTAKAEAQGSWAAEAHMTYARVGFGAGVGVDGRLFVFGGHRGGHPSERWQNMAEAYSPAAGSWSAIASMPVGTDTFATATGQDGLIYVFGGIVATYSITSNAFTYDPNTDTWSTIPSLPAPRYSHAGAVDSNGRVYAIGGTSNGFSNLSSVVTYDPSVGIWNNVASMAVPRIYATACRGADGRIYVFGGRDAVTNEVFNSLEIYDPASDSWMFGAPMPTARSHVSSVEAGGRIYVFGGEDALGQPTNIVEAYDPTSDTWSTVASMPHGRLSTAAAASGGRIFVFGGFGDGIYSNNTQVFTPPVLDSTPPTTTNSLSGPAGLNGWYTGPVQVSLNATDPAPGTVAATYYVLDGDPQETYSGPFLVTGDGVHSVSFWSVDQAGNVETAQTITISIDSLSPVVDPQSLNTPEDNALPVTLSGSDGGSGFGGIVSITQPAHGVLTGVAPNLLYTPAVNYNGPDSFTFTVRDIAGNLSVGAIQLSISPVNDPPAANPQSVSVVKNVAKAITLTGSDPDGDPLTFRIISRPRFGALIGNEPNLTYIPRNNFTGTDSFTFIVTDIHGFSTMPATVSITVSPGNRPPIIGGDMVTTFQGVPVGFNVLANDFDPDGDPISLVSWSQPQFGWLYYLGGGNFMYIPYPGYWGKDGFSYQITDGRGNYSMGWVGIRVLR